MVSSSRCATVFLLVKWHSPTQLHVEVWRQDKLLPPDVGNLATSSFRARLTQAASDLFGAANVPNLAEDIGNVALILSSPTPGGKSMQTTLQKSGQAWLTGSYCTPASRVGSFITLTATLLPPSGSANIPRTTPCGRRAFDYGCRTSSGRAKTENRGAACCHRRRIIRGSSYRRAPEVVREQALGTL
jgi:hypothetical protein